MKKTIIFLTMALASATIFGGVIPWKSGALYVPDADGNYTSTSAKVGTAAYFQYWLVTQDAYNTYSAMSQAELYNAIKGGAFAETSSYIETSTRKSTVMGAANWTAGTTFAKKDFGYVVGLYEYTLGSGDDAQNFYLAVTGYDQINDVDCAIGIASGNLAPMPPASWQTPVPEPTTLALLAFGLVAVGARRKLA